MRVALVMLALLAGLTAAWSVPRADNRVSFLKNELIELALDQLRSPGSFDVTVGSVEDSDDGLTTLLDVRVSDGSGIWMTVERLAFAWQPKRLLVGELAISHLEVSGATVLRAPAAEAEWPELETQPPWQRHVLDWPRAPIALALDRVRLERIDIKEGVLPQAIRFDAEGSLYDREDVQEVTLAVQRTDAVAGEIMLETRRAFAAGTLRLVLSTREAAGGMVASAAGFPADAPARLKLSGDGPPDDWRLSFEAAVEGVFTAEGQAAVAYASALAVDTEFSMRPGPAMDPEIRALLGAEARLTATMTERSGGQLDIAAAELTADAVTLRLSGALATTAGHNDLTVSLVAGSPAAALIDGVAFDRLTFDGAVSGPRGGLEASGVLAVEAAASAFASAARVTAKADVMQVSEGAEFVLAGSAENLRVARIASDAIGDALLRVEGTVRDRRLVVEQADLSSRLLSGQARGHYDMSTGTGQVTTSLEARDLAPLTGPAGIALRGAMTAFADIRLTGEHAAANVMIEARQLEAGPLSLARAALAGQVSRTGEEWVLDLTCDGTDLEYDGVPRGLATDVDVTMRGSFLGDTLHIAALEFESPLLEAATRGHVDVAAGLVDLTYRLRAPDLARVAGAYDLHAAGAVDAAGRAAGTLGDLQVDGEATVSEGAFNGRSYGRVRLTHEIRVGDPIAGPVGIAMDEGWLGKSTASAYVRLDRSTWRLEDVRADLSGMTLESDAVIIAPDTMLVDGSGTVVSPDLGPLAAIASVSASGTAQGTFTFRAREGRQTLTSTLRLVDAEVAGLRARHAAIDVAMQDLTTGEGLDVRVSGTSGSIGTITVNNVDIKATGAFSAMTFSAAAEGVLGTHRLNLALAGRATAGGGLVGVTLDSGSASIGQERVDLGRPVELHIDRSADLIEARKLDLRLSGGGRIGGTVSKQSNGFFGRLRGTRVPMALLGQLGEVPIASGSLDVAASFDTRRPGASAALEASVLDLVLTGVEAEHALSADLSGRWDGARLTLQTAVRGGFGEPVEARLALPVHVGEGGVPRLSEREAIDGTLSWRGEIADLWVLLPRSPHVAEGKVDLQLRFAGTVDAPRLSGHADVTRGRYDHVEAGLALVDITVQAAMTDSAVVTLQSSASDGGRGRIEGSATVHWNPRPTIDAVVHVDRAALLQRDDITALVSGTGRLHGPWSDLTFGGAFEVNEAEVRLIDATPLDAMELDGVRLAHAAKSTEVEEARTVSLDVTVRADRSVFVRGRGLESEWGLDLRATGDVTAPVLSGAVRKIRGSLDLLGRPFELTRGEIVFDGTKGLDPTIDVGLERHTGDIHGGIYVDGHMSQPHIRFGSRSGLPPDEVLSRLLFGVSQQSLTGAQALQLSLGVARLLGQGIGIQDRLREAVGVDVLRVSGTTVDDAAVTVGQNLGERVFVGAEQEIGSGQSSIVVEIEVMESVVVDSRVESGQGANIGVNWRHDY